MNREQTILVADDNLDDVLQIQCLFKKVRIVNPLQSLTDGEKVLSYLDGSGIYQNRETYPYPILLLLDLKMPRKSGFDVLESLHHHPLHESLPVIVLSASDDLRQINKAYQLGARSFLNKPICSDDFRNVLKGLKGIDFKLVKDGFRLQCA